ncbi:hypothetical protein ScPMuIL_010082 [Solemya velum]
MACKVKIGGIPFGSLIAAIIVFVGVAVFCGTLYKALNIILRNVMEDLFGFKVSWLEVIQVVFIVIALVMAAFAILLLVFGFLATGATRKNVYSGAKCIMGGRVSAIFFMMTTYILNLAWIFILSIGVVPVILYVAINSICSNEVYGRNPDSIHYKFELKNYGIFRNSSYAFGISPPGTETLTESQDLKRMCDRVGEAGPLFCVAYAGALLMVLGMVHFMICLAANYTRICISKELTEYRDAVDMEELELHSNMVDKMGSQGRL